MITEQETLEDTTLIVDYLTRLSPTLGRNWYGRKEEWIDVMYPVVTLENTFLTSAKAAQEQAL